MSIFLAKMWFILNYLSAIAIAGHGIFFAVNRMSRCTEHWIRWAWITMTVGAIAILAGPLYGYSLPVWQEVILNIGTAIYVIRDRRCIFGCYRHKPTEHPLVEHPSSDKQ